VIAPECADSSRHFLVSDKYGPSLYEFNRDGILMKIFTTPANLTPRNAITGVPNYASDADNTAGKRTNRGFRTDSPCPLAGP
jgi:hypothetical protein